MTGSGNRLAAAMLWLTFLGPGCAAEEEDPPPRLLDVGDPCHTTIRYCVDDAAVQRCEDDIWTVETCDEVCAGLGSAYVADACVDDDCAGVLTDPGGCVPDETSCADANAVSICDELQVWETVNCDEVCEESGLLSLGCVDDAGEAASCWCTAEGTPCDPALPPVCADTATLARCQDGIWSFDDCGAACDDPAQGQCVAWATPSYCACS